MAARGAMKSFDDPVYSMGCTLGNLVIRFRQCASVWGLIGCVAAPAPSKAPAASRIETEGPKTLLAKHQSLEAPRAEPSPASIPLSLPTSLPISGFEPAVIRFPDDRQASPLFVVTHGAGGQANWHCSHYAELLGPSAALLCPCGKRMVTRDPARGYYYPDHIALSGELTAVRAAVEEHSDLLQLEASVYIGYSQGASMGVLAVASHGDWWPRLALVEGGYDAWY